MSVNTVPSDIFICFLNQAIRTVLYKYTAQGAQPCLQVSAFSVRINKVPFTEANGNAVAAGMDQGQSQKGGYTRIING